MGKFAKVLFCGAIGVTACVLVMAGDRLSVHVTRRHAQEGVPSVTHMSRPGCGPAPRVRPEGVGPEPAFVLVHDATMVVDAGWVSRGQALDFSQGRMYEWPAGPYTVVVSQGDRWGRLAIVVAADDEPYREYAVPVTLPGETVRVRAVRGDTPVAGGEVRIDNYAHGRLSFGGVVGLTNPEGWITIRGVPSDATALHISVLDGDSGRHGSIPRSEWERTVFDLGPR